jgi:hypothetical protein
MTPFITLVAILASPSVYRQVQPIARIFSCVGEGKSEGHPFGVQKTGKHFFCVGRSS